MVSTRSHDSDRIGSNQIQMSGICQPLCIPIFLYNTDNDNDKVIIIILSLQRLTISDPHILLVLSHETN
jgi:hypothetical protein